MRAKLVLLFAATAASAQAPSVLESINAHVTADGLKADVSFLASDLLEGRGTPSRGLDLAAEYIAAEFRRGGLEPAGDQGYFQTADFASVTPNTDGIEFTLEAGGKTFQPDKASIALLNAAAADLHRVPAVIADANALDSLSPDQVGGKVLLLVAADATAGGGRAGNAGGRGGVPQTTLQRLKPAAVVTVRGAAQAGGRAARGGRGGRGPQLREASAISGTASLTVADTDLAAALSAKPSGAVVSLHVAAPTITQVKLRNVAGLLRGSDTVLRDTYIIVTGHYDHLGIRDNGTPDHIYNGADDDASGTSSVIEVGKALAALPGRPKRSILFVTLFGEEVGELGSHFYSEHPIFPLAKTIADVNLEQLGRTDDTEGPRVGAFNLTGFDYTDIAAYFVKAGRQTGIQAVKHEKNSDSYFGRSDNAAFANVGVPSTTLSVAYNFPDYHGAGDEWQKLDYENMAKVDRTIALAILDMANSAQVPKWDAANPKVERYVKAREASLAAAK
jgi:hypothetical protein